jgi:hypothetical protein
MVSIPENPGFLVVLDQQDQVEHYYFVFVPPAVYTEIWGSLLTENAGPHDVT